MDKTKCDEEFEQTIVVCRHASNKTFLLLSLYTGIKALVLTSLILVK